MATSVLIKAAAGGGGGMLPVHRPSDLHAAIARIQNDARKLYNDDQIYLEKYLTQPRHIEVQILQTNLAMLFVWATEIAPYNVDIKRLLKRPLQF